MLKDFIGIRVNRDKKSGMVYITSSVNSPESFFFKCYGHHRDLHSFPTRRSSDLKDNTVFANLYLILKHDVNIRDVSREVQQQVARALQEMVSMDIGEIEIHIEDIDYGDEEAQSP